MPTFQEIGQTYATQIRAAIAQDSVRGQGYIKKAYASESIDPKSMGSTTLADALKKIIADLNNVWKVDNKPLTSEQRDEILRQTGVALGMPDPSEFGLIAKGASNDAYMTLVERISIIVQPVKK